MLPHASTLVFTVNVLEALVNRDLLFTMLKEMSVKGDPKPAILLLISVASAEGVE